MFIKEFRYPQQQKLFQLTLINLKIRSNNQSNNDTTITQQEITECTTVRHDITMYDIRVIVYNYVYALVHK